MGIHPITGTPPPRDFRQVSLTVRWVERGTVRVKCLAQEHNAMTRPGLEPGPLDPLIRQSRLPPFWTRLIDGNTLKSKVVIIEAQYMSNLRMFFQQLSYDYWMCDIHIQTAQKNRLNQFTKVRKTQNSNNRSFSKECFSMKVSRTERIEIIFTRVGVSPDGTLFHYLKSLKNFQKRKKNEIDTSWQVGFSRALIVATHVHKVSARRCVWNITRIRIIWVLTTHALTQRTSGQLYVKLVFNKYCRLTANWACIQFHK